MTAVALFVGDAGWDTTVVAPRIPEPDEKILVELCHDAMGGVAANSAAACGFAGARVRLVSTVGSDPAGEAIRAQLREMGMDALLEPSGGDSVRAVILLDGAEKRLLLCAGARMYPSTAFLSRVPLDDVGWMHTAVYDRPAAAAIIDRCRGAGIPWSIDLEPATFADDGISALAPHLRGCALVIVNSRAAAAIGGDVATRLRALGAQTVVQTLGSRGARVHEPGSAPVDVAAAMPARLPRDTTGAGDAFAGTLVAELLRGAGLPDAASRAVEVAGRTVVEVGAIASYPVLPGATIENPFMPERRKQ